MSGNTQSRDFGALTSKVFFNADHKSQDTTLLTYFRSGPELTLIRDTGWTMYPPTNDRKEPLPFHRFSFSKHPFLNSNFDRGEMMVITSVEKDRVVGMSLSLSFTSKNAFEKQYTNLTVLYSKYASQVINRNVAQPFEVTKYISKNKKDFVIITKGENGDKPYIHIAYNYQDYEW